MTTPRYVPILKGKAGELDALKLVQTRTRQAMVPLVELAPREEAEMPAGVASNCKKAIAKLAKSYPEPVMLDGGLFDLDVVVDGGRGVVGLLADTARAEGLAAQPVLRITDPARAMQEAADAHAADGRGLTMRLLGDDLDEDPDDLDLVLDDVLSRTGTTRPDVDLLLDTGPIDGDVAVRGASRLIVSLLRDLPNVDQWRTVTVAAGAFPIDLSQYSANTLGERPRYDAQLFDRVRTKRLPRQPDYGDYAVAHPELVVGVAFSPPPQLRYTVADRWLILKGRRNDPRGNGQFHHICTVIARHPEFAGTPVGSADQRIAAGSPAGPGDGTTWRQIGTTHHLDYVTLRLTTYGEP
jgi:hypothetical protein